MKDEMVKVLLYENGNIEIKPEENYRVTQHMYFTNKKGCGDAYYCKKGKEAFYIKKMLSQRKKDLEKQMEKLKAIEIRVNEKLSELKGE